MERFFVSCLEFVLMLTLSAMVLLVFGNVVLRYGFNSGITVSEELSRYAFVWTIFIGALLVMRDRAHLGVTGLVERLPIRLRRACKFASDLIALGCTLCLLVGTWLLAADNFTNYSPVSGMPLGVVYLSGVICCSGIALLLLHSLFLQITGRMPDEALFVTPEAPVE